MTEDTSLIAEAKPVTRPIPGPNTKSIVQREIEQFINMASVVDEKNNIIAGKDRILIMKNNTIQQLNTEKTHLVQVLAETRERLQVSESKVRTLTTEIEGGPYRYGYKRTIADLELNLGRTQTKLEISEKLLAESKKDKDRLYSLVEKTINRIK